MLEFLSQKKNSAWLGNRLKLTFFADCRIKAAQMYFWTSALVEMMNFLMSRVDLVQIESQTLGLFCVTCQMFKMNLLLITHPFLWWYHVAKLYWKCYIAFWPLVPSIHGFKPIVSWKLTCAHIILHRFTRIVLIFCTHKDNWYNGPMHGNYIAYRYHKTENHTSAIDFSKLYYHFKKSWSTLVYTAGFL